MTLTLKINSKNDIHLPAKVLGRLRLGEDRIVKLEVTDNTLVIMPVDLEPRYSRKELEGLDRLHQDEWKKGFRHLKTHEDIDKLLK